LGGSARTRRRAAVLLAAAGASALGATGCGGNQKQDKSEAKANFPVKLVRASFPRNQSLAKNSTLEIVVQNAGQQMIPDISVTVKCGSALGGSFSTATQDTNVADPERPQFIVNKLPTATDRVNPPLDPAPLERSSSYVDTYPLGPLGPRHTATFMWDVTAVKAGPYHLCWRVNAGLYGKAKAVPASGSAPVSGEFKGKVSNKPPKATIGPDGRSIIESP
jgi:hypothetical protein